MNPNKMLKSFRKLHSFAWDKEPWLSIRSIIFLVAICFLGWAFDGMPELQSISFGTVLFVLSSFIVLAVVVYGLSAFYLIIKEVIKRLTS